MISINPNPIIILCDIDDTLVSFHPIEGCDPIKLNYGPLSYNIYPILKNIEILKQMKMRGIYVRAHSQGGFKWAEAALSALGLLDFVDSVECKPKWYLDDLDANKWMSRIDLQNNINGR